jgi:hypothetical protein
VFVEPRLQRARCLSCRVLSSRAVQIHAVPGTEKKACDTRDTYKILAGETQEK